MFDGRKKVKKDRSLIRWYKIDRNANEKKDTGRWKC